VLGVGHQRAGWIVGRWLDRSRAAAEVGLVEVGGQHFELGVGWRGCGHGGASRLGVLLLWVVAW